MGLEEKRVLKDIQDGALKTTQSKIKALIGADVAIDIDVDSFTTASALESLKYSGLPALVETLEDIAKDDLGKEALKKALKKVVFKNNTNNGDDSTATFDKGTLTNTSTFGGGGYAGVGEMSKALNAKL